jgi:hypothetical protein
LNIDPIAQIIPLAIDYILEYKMAEEKSLSSILQVDEKKVRMAL